jgi:hypothetical protein
VSETSWIRIEVRIGEGYQPRPIDGDVVRVHEQDNVRVCVDVVPTDALPEAMLDARPLSWDAGQCAFLIEDTIIAHWVGTVELTIRAGAREQTLAVEVVPRPKKATPDDWLRMLRQIEQWLPGVSVGADGGRHGRVGEHGVSAPLLAEALAPLLPRFARALADVVRLPQVGERLFLQDTSLRATGKVDRESVRWVGRHPDAAQWFRADEPGGPEPRIPQRRAMTHMDHPANRHLAWLVPRVLAELGRVRDGLVRLAEHYDEDGSLNDTGVWCRARAEQLGLHLRDIERLWATSPLRNLPPLAVQTAALESIIDHPSYAQVHQLGRLLLAPRFRLPESDARMPEAHAAPVRASFHLYELWTFLFVQRSLALHLTAPEWEWQDRELPRLLELTDSGSGACFEARGPAGELLEIRFNEPFSAYTRRNTGRAAATPVEDAPHCYSLTQGRRPDLLVRMRRPGQDGRWIFLDAKYYEPASLSTPMQALHIYRDALWMERYGGRCRAGLLLVPNCSKKYAAASPEFHARFDIGVWKCPPGAAPDPALGEWILSRLRA